MVGRRLGTENIVRGRQFDVVLETGRQLHVLSSQNAAGRGCPRMADQTVPRGTSRASGQPCVAEIDKATAAIAGSAADPHGRSTRRSRPLGDFRRPQR